MPTSSVGRVSNGRSRAGVTILEMLVVVTLIGVMVSVSFPAVTSGIDSLRLSSSSDAVVSFLNSALNRAERRQEVMELTFSKPDNKITMRSSEPNFIRELDFPVGVKITAILPEIHGEDDAVPRHVFVYPSGTVPRVGVELANRRGLKKRVMVDPMTGVPQVEIIASEEKK